MNCLSIILAIAFVSYSLGAPEIISESQSGDQNYGLEKRNGVGAGNDDPSTSDPSEIEVFGPKRKPTPTGRNKMPSQKPKDSKDSIARTKVCTGICAAACVSRAETIVHV